MNKKPVVLIVDDQEDIRFSIKLSLKNEGYEFVEAENGLQAIDVVKEITPSIILMDAVMPEMNGFETTLALRKNILLERTPILMVTALTDKKNHIDALEAGVSDFVQKPFDKHELIARCRSYVNMVQLNSKYIDATQNPNTKLPNRAALENDLKKMNDPLVIVCSIDGYDELLEFYSFDAINKMEEEFARICIKCIALESESYTFYHTNSGIFTIALDLSNNDDLTKEKLTELSQEFCDEVRSQSIKFDDYEFTPLITLGISVAEKSPYENAITAMYKAQKKRVPFLFADDVMELAYKEIRNNIVWIKKIKLALEEDRFLPYFHPIHNNKTDTIDKYECLIRMIDVDGEIISPYHFLDISKRAKYYHQLTRLMFDKSFRVFAKRKEKFSINLSGGDIENADIRAHILNALEKQPNVAKRLIFELLEDESFISLPILKSFIADIKQFGVRIAIDDFGSGYSNFKRIMEFQPDILKIDGSLIQNIGIDPYSLNIVSTIQSFAEKSGLITVAEFVETESIYKCVSKLGIDYSQGYYFSEPMSLEELDNIK